jgi:hypothetical protein
MSGFSQLVFKCNAAVLKIYFELIFMNCNLSDCSTLNPHLRLEVRSLRHALSEGEGNTTRPSPLEKVPKGRMRSDRGEALAVFKMNVEMVISFFIFPLTKF